MDKKKGVKLGVCSLLVGLLALTACKKKTTTTKDSEKTTVKPTTQVNPTTTKTNSTTKNTTTENKEKTLSGFNVYVDGRLCNGENDTLNLERKEEGFNIFSHLKVEAIYSDDSKEELTLDDYDVETNLTPDADLGEYDLSIAYKDFTPKSIKINVGKTKIDLSNVKFEESSFTYDGTEKKLKLVNLPKILWSTDIGVEITGDEATDAGEYTANVEFTNCVYYEVVNVPEALTNYKWNIKKADASITSITNPTRDCNGKAVEIDYESNLGKIATVYYKEKGASDDAYTTVAPKDLGDYIAKVVIEDTTNYNGCERVIDFSLYKAIIAAPRVYSDYNKAGNCASMYTGEEQSFLDYLIGYNPDVMEFTSDSDSVYQTEAGEYSYKFQIKEEERNNIELDSNMKNYWQIQNKLSTYVESITIDGESISVDDFENLTALKEGSKLVIVPKAGYQVRDLTLTSQNISSIEHELIYSYFRLFIFTEGEYSTTDVYSKTYNVNLFGVDYITVNGKRYSALDYTATSFTKIYFDRIDGKYVDVSIKGVGSDITELYYKIGNTKYTLDVCDQDVRIDVGDAQVVKLYFCDAYSDRVILLNANPIVKKLIGTFYNPETLEFTYDEVPFDSTNDRFRMDLTSTNLVLLDLKPIFNEYYSNMEFEFIKNIYSNEKLELEEIHGTIYAYMYCYYNGELASKIYIDIRGKKPYFNYGIQYNNIGNYYKLVSESTYELPTLEGFELYIDGKKASSNILTFDTEGIYKHKIEYVVHGAKDYRYTYDLVIAHSANLFDYVESCSISNDVNSYVMDAIEGENANFISESTFMNNYISYVSIDSFNITTKEGYVFNKDKSTYEIEPRGTEKRLIKYMLVFEKDNKEYKVYGALFYSGELYDNTYLAEEKMSLYVNDTFIAEEDIIDNTINFTIPKKQETTTFKLYINNSEKHINFSLCKDEYTYISAYKDNEYTYFNVGVGTYVLKIFSDDHFNRDITINITTGTDFINITRKGDISEANVHLDQDGKGLIFGQAVGEAYAYMGDSKDYIIDNSYIELNISGVYKNRVYKDRLLTEKAKETDRYEVYYDGVKPYVIMYVNLTSPAITMTLKVYLCEKEIIGARIKIGETSYDAVLNGTTDCGDLTQTGIKTYVIEGNDCSNIITVTTTKVYDDYSYAVLVFDEEDEGKDLSYYVEHNLIYKVTDSTTLSVTIPLNKSYFFMLREGTTEANFYENISMIRLEDTSIFNIELGNDKIYQNIGWSLDAFTIYEKTNAIFSTGSIAEFVSISSQLGFKLDRSILDYIDVEKGIVKAKITSFFDIKLYKDSSLEEEITLNEDGTFDLPINNYGTATLYISFHYAEKNVDAVITVYVITSN